MSRTVINEKMNKGKTTTAYTLRQIKYYYAQELVLNLPNLDIPRGIISGLSGPNGSGKSTLLKILALLEKPSKGELTCLGQATNCINESLQRSVTLLLQENCLLNRTVWENIAYALKVRGITEDSVCSNLILQSLALVGLEPDFLNRQARKLSGGEAGRVALAARLVFSPEILLLDEPNAGLDAQAVDMVSQSLIKINQEKGTSIIIASHDLDWLQSINRVGFKLKYGSLVG